jgi:pimeloyl-ACP methyl ester carboxylesterase
MRKTLIHLASQLAPQLMVRIAHNHLNNPQVRKLRDHEEAVLQTADVSIYPFKGFDIKLYHWRGEGPRVLLIHGWEGQAGNFSDLIVALRSAGYDIMAFDGPSHGHSSKGLTSPIEFAELVKKLVPVFRPRHLISHSFGGVATTFALSELPDFEVESYTMVTTPDRFMDRIQEISRQVGVSDKVRDLLIDRMRGEVDTPLEKLNVSEWVKGMNVGRGLILHDRADRVIPLEVSQRVHQSWPGSVFEVVEGTGHFRILRSPDVVSRIVSFVSESHTTG